MCTPFLQYVPSKFALIDRFRTLGSLAACVLMLCVFLGAGYLILEGKHVEFGMEPLFLRVIGVILEIVGFGSLVLAWVECLRR